MSNFGISHQLSVLFRFALLSLLLTKKVRRRQESERARQKGRQTDCQTRQTEGRTQRQRLTLKEISFFLSSVLTALTTHLAKC